MQLEDFNLSEIDKVLPPKPTESKKHPLSEHGVDGSGSGGSRGDGGSTGTKPPSDHGDRRGRSDEDASGENKSSKSSTIAAPKNEFFFDTKNDDTKKDETSRSVQFGKLR